MSTARSGEEIGDIMHSIGYCMMVWATVETHLNLLFHTLFGADRELADLMWSRVRSFDAKLQIMHDVATKRLQSDPHKRDWNLLRDHTKTLYSKRNMIAHSTMITTEDGATVLEPFSVPTRPSSSTLNAENIDAFAAQFGQLTDAITAFNLVLIQTSRHQQSLEPDNGLLLSLRIEDDRKREAQRHRNLAVNQYLDRHPELKPVLFPK